MPIDFQGQIWYNIITVKERSVENATDALVLDTVPALGGHSHSEQPRAERSIISQ